MSTQDQKWPSSYNMFLHANFVCVNNEIVNSVSVVNDRYCIFHHQQNEAKSLGNRAWITHFTSIGEMLTNLAPAITGQEI